MKPDNKAGGPWLYALGLVPVIWVALLIAPAISGGLSEIVSALPAAMNNPFKIVWCEDSVKLSSFLLPPMGWALAFISHPGAITAEAKNTVPPNGAIRGL